MMDMRKSSVRKSPAEYGTLSIVADAEFGFKNKKSFREINNIQVVTNSNDIIVSYRPTVDAEIVSVNVPTSYFA